MYDLLAGLYFNDPLTGLLVVLKTSGLYDLIISQRSTHIMHTIF